MSELSHEDRQTLNYLAKYNRLIWGGVYDRGGEADLVRLEVLGLIEGVAEPYMVGKIKFSGGYRITDAGRSLYRAMLQNDILRRSRDHQRHKRDLARTALNRQHKGIEYWRARALSAESKLEGLGVKIDTEAAASANFEAGHEERQAS